MKLERYLFIIIFYLITFYNCHSNIVNKISIIPKPTEIKEKYGYFTITSKTQIIVGENDEINSIVNYLKNKLDRPTGFDIKIVNIDNNQKSENSIILELENKNNLLGNEGYILDINERTVHVIAEKPAGLFYGIQSIRQLLPPDIESCETIKNVKWEIPCVLITDKPEYRWRGMMLDVSRHFFNKEYVKELIDYLAMYKLNKFHIHLVDDQGWRIEIKKYPKLTEIGSWRVDREDMPWDSREPQKKGEKATYGGYFTQNDIREIVEYAKSRYITIIPEIEMPAHVSSALAAYPEYSCTGGPFTVPPGGVWPITDIYCAGNDKTFEFLQNILSEVIELFPGEYIHIGGDEATKTEWKKCPKCQTRIKNEGLKNEQELQSYFVKRIEKFLISKNKKLIGWDEILEGGLAPEATVMSWRGTKGGIESAKQGHDVVMSPTSNCYFDYYQGIWDFEPLTIGGFLPLKKVYSFEPTPDKLTTDEKKHILGGQANLWTEYQTNPQKAQYMTFPRIAALSEVVWSQKNNRDWNDFANRIVKEMKRYDSAGINYARSVFQVSVNPRFIKEKKDLDIELKNELPQAVIRYTLDGTNPTTKSKKYTKPFVINTTTFIKTGAFIDGKLQGVITEKKFPIHKATGKPIQIKSPYKKVFGKYDEYELTNSIRGSKYYRDGLWQCYECNELEIVVDLDKETPVSKISAGFMQKMDSKIFMPVFVKYSVSNDGKNFNEVGVIENDIPLKIPNVIIKNFAKKISNINTRYIKVNAKNIGTCPEWHQDKGKPALLLIDEIIVE